MYIEKKDLTRMSYKTHHRMNYCGNKEEKNFFNIYDGLCRKSRDQHRKPFKTAIISRFKEKKKPGIKSPKDVVESMTKMNKLEIFKKEAEI